MSFDYSAIIGAAAQNVDSMMNGLLGSHITFKQNMKLAKYQNDLSMQNWREQNAYNTPAAQMERYKQAGLNPYLVGHGAASGSAASGVPSYPNITGLAPDYAGIGRQAQQDRMNTLTTLMQYLLNLKDMDIKDATKENIQAQTENTRQQTASELWKYTNLFPLHKTREQKEIGNLIERNFLLSLQSQGQAITNAIGKYNYDFILPIEQQIKYWNMEQAKYNRQFLSPAQRVSLLAGAALATQKAEGQRIENLYSPSYYTLRNGNLGLDFFNKRTENQYYNWFGTRNPGDVKLGPFPIGAVSSGINSTLYDMGKKLKNWKPKNTKNYRPKTSYYGIKF